MDIPAIVALVPALAPYGGYITTTIGVCALIATQMPPPANPKGFYAKAYWLINRIGANDGHAANAAQVTK